MWWLLESSFWLDVFNIDKNFQRTNTLQKYINVCKLLAWTLLSSDSEKNVKVLSMVHHLKLLTSQTRPPSQCNYSHNCWLLMRSNLLSISLSSFLGWLSRKTTEIVLWQLRTNPFKFLSCPLFCTTDLVIKWVQKFLVISFYYCFNNYVFMSLSKLLSAQILPCPSCLFHTTQPNIKFLVNLQ